MVNFRHNYKLHQLLTTNTYILGRQVFRKYCTMRIITYTCYFCTNNILHYYCLPGRILVYVI